MNAAINVKHLLPVWEQFRAATDITPIRDEAHCARMTEMLQALLDETQGEEKHPAMGLADIVGDLIEDYESKQHPLPDVTGVQALKFLMEQHGLKQSELTEIGSQGVVSEIQRASANSTFAKCERSANGLAFLPRPLCEGRGTGSPPRHEGQTKLSDAVSDTHMKGQRSAHQAPHFATQTPHSSAGYPGVIRKARGRGR